jgi:hypothetical protein
LDEYGDTLFRKLKERDTPQLDTPLIPRRVNSQKKQQRNKGAESGEEIVREFDIA